MIEESYLRELDARLAAAGGVLEFSPNELRSMSVEDGGKISAHFSGQMMMRLPEQEIAFFDWLKINDRAVWDELWGGGTEPYTVAIAFLSSFLGDAPGFPICDLDGDKNFYFHKDFIIDVEKERIVGEVLKKTRASEPLAMSDVFLLEIWLHPIDIWRFAYKYEYPVDVAKSMIGELVEQEILRHPATREELADFVEL